MRPHRLPAAPGHAGLLGLHEPQPPAGVRRRPRLPGRLCPPALPRLLQLLCLVVVLGLPRPLASLLGGPTAAEAAPTSLRTIRLGITPERTRIVLDLSSPRYTWRASVLDERALVVFLDGVENHGASAPAGGGLLREAGLSESGPDGLALRLALKRPVRHRIFPLDAGGGRPPRLVIDLLSQATPGRGAGKTGAPAPSGTPEPIRGTPDPRRQGPRVIVVDPGHGGGDPGAVGPGLKEKDVCLDVARRLVALLDATPGLDGVLTREKDTRIPLRTRMRFAEKRSADLFVSIHVNAATARGARGVEVFFLSLGAATDEAAREAARLENEADPDWVVEEDEDLRGLPFSVSLRQSDTLLRSSRAAEQILDALTGRDLAQPRGVKQAGFAVLKSFQVPSVLVELGFISSARDRENLKREEHRAALAAALAEGIRGYLATSAPRRQTTTVSAGAE